MFLTSAPATGAAGVRGKPKWLVFVEGTGTLEPPTEKSSPHNVGARANVQGNFEGPGTFLLVSHSTWHRFCGVSPTEVGYPQKRTYLYSLQPTVEGLTIVVCSPNCQHVVNLSTSHAWHLLNIHSATNRLHLKRLKRSLVSFDSLGVFFKVAPPKCWVFPLVSLHGHKF